MRQLWVLLTSTVLITAAAPRSGAQNAPLDADEKGSKAVPLSLSPEAKIHSVGVTKLASFPRAYWASGLKPGEVAIIDGVISVRDGGPENQRILLPGVALNDQPTFGLDPIEGDTSPAATRKVLDQTRQFADWAATYFGRALPPTERKRLQLVYRSMADTGAFLSSRTPSLAPERTRLAMAGFLSRALIRERAIFDPYPAARDTRYTRVRSRAQPVDSARLRAALYAWMEHDAPRPGVPPLGPAPQDERLYKRGYFPNFARMEASFSGQLKPPYIITCHGDTVFETHLVESVPLNWYESRIVVAIHPVAGTIRDILEYFGVNNDWLYHSSIGGAVWEAFADRRIRSTYRVIKCELKASDSTFTAPYPGVKTLIKADSFTNYRLTADHWSYANGASGTYPHTYSHSDELIVVKRKVFDNENAHARAVRWLHTPTPAANGVYHRIRAVAYSVGDYGENWICQVSLNAFAVRRYAFAPIGEPAAALVYGLYGNRGISSRSFYGKIIKGCVPGAGCFYNTPIVAKGTLEHFLAGKGYNLDQFWSPRLNSWYNSDADYESDHPEWPLSSEVIASVVGWP